jgi:hypothetical protein
MEASEPKSGSHGSNIPLKSAGQATQRAALERAFCGGGHVPTWQKALPMMHVQTRQLMLA